METMEEIGCADSVLGEPTEENYTQPHVSQIYPSLKSTPRFSSVDLFVKSLKIISDHEVPTALGTDRELYVTGFNHVLWHEITKATPGSLTHDPRLCSFDEICAMMFVEGELWKSRDFLYNVISVIASTQ